MQRPLSLATVVLVAACGAKLEGGLIENEIPDGNPVDAFVTPPDAPPDARPCAGGDSRATDSTGSCFLFFVGPRTRLAAETDCTANNAHLAKIENAEQNAVVLSLAIGRDAFIGATDVVAEGTYLWHDGTPLTFQNFRSGEPNNANGQFEEDCLIIEGALDGTWDDRPCAPPPAGTGSYAYVCQF
jgi:hypothetical protein